MISDGSALFRAVRENPADNNPRLVYADWLQENGQPERGEFILLQCEAWQLCPAYPTVTEARNAASRLLKRYGDLWFSELPALPGVTWSNLFVRGFVDTAWVVAGKDFHNHVPLLLAATPLQYLTILTSDFRAVEALLRVEGIEHLTSVQFDGLPHTPKRQRLHAEARTRFPRTHIS
jgi:uncharacterized protein (TIGR02996 family)